MPPTAFVTGATSGFGEAITRRFVAEGWRVVATGRRGERLEALQAELGDAVHTIVLDVRDRDAVIAAAEHLPEGFRPVRVLVANAGLALGLGPADRADLDDWDTMVDTNVKGLMYTVRAVLPQMVAAGGGHVVTIGSVAGSYPYPGGNVYGATKAFVAQLALNLRADLVAKGIRVTDIEPGLAETEFSVVRFKGDAEKAGKVYEGIAPIRPEDIADTVWWAVTRPPHINVNRIEIMAECQSFGPFQVVRS
ncbi:MAG: SDR family NAD(P)-dependent oxidoreductase [Pseudomonadota bacterium]|nr:SDR family NAD(P)-dependent oxidoreductase [Pseudomonadota bacterium]